MLNESLSVNLLMKATPESFGSNRVNPILSWFNEQEIARKTKTPPKNLIIIERNVYIVDYKVCVTIIIGPFEWPGVARLQASVSLSKCKPPLLSYM